MSGLESEHIETSSGKVKYYRFLSGSCEPRVLFLHGLGYDRQWFTSHLQEYALHQFSWIVPDLMGHGTSTKSTDPAAYTMDRQASYLADILSKEQVKQVVLIAHSMGGPIAISLIEQLNRLGSVTVKGLLYLEGNLDMGDAFFSSKAASMAYEKFRDGFEQWCERTIENAGDPILVDWVRHLRAAGPFTVWHSSVDLVRVSADGNLLNRLQKALDTHVCFIFGEKNRGLYTSEKLITEAGLPVLFIPDSGHAMFLENPSEFWPRIFQLIKEYR